MRLIYLLALTILFSNNIHSQLDIDLESFGTGFINPVGIKNAGDSRLFIVEKSGYVHILNSDGSTNITPFLDIEPLVLDVSGLDERGFLGLVFDPNYSSNGYFYVNYINVSGNTVISRFSVSSNPDIADETTELIILTYTQPYPNHNGGDLQFGADGYLYISSGDGGSFGDPDDNSQNLESLLGKILRIDVSSSTLSNLYDIPGDNPFVSNPMADDEIWAYGLRNPWKFSFDSLNSNLWIGDVGENIVEEINMISSSSSGMNFGWRCYEGSSEFNLTDCPAMGTLTFPVAQYTHNSSGNFKCSITGGYVHRGSTHTDFNGYYFFADYCSNEIGYLDFDGGDFTISYTDPFSGNGWSSFGEDINGELYISGAVSGTIYKVIPGNLSTNEFDSSSIKMFPNPTNSVVNFEFISNQNIDEIIIFDIRGKVISKYEDFSDNSTYINVESLSQGMYLVKILNRKGNSAYKKLIIN